MSIELGRRLMASGLVSSEEVEAALFLSVARGLPFARVLVDRGAITERALETELERVGGLGLRQVSGAAEVVKRLPRALCRRLAALPTRVDPATGTIDVAAADPLDPHVATELGFHLGAPIRVLRAPIAAIEEAIRRLELEDNAPAARFRERRVTPPFPHGAPQSTIPPPIADETPIPLVRKVPGLEATPRTETLVPPSGAPPISMSYGERIALPPLGADLGAHVRHAVAAPPPDRRARLGSGMRMPVIAEHEPPAVSFPSMPPEAEDTPPHGSRVFAASAAAPLDRSSRDVYRIAPPADEAFPRRAAVPASAVNASSAVNAGSAADLADRSLPRRPSRPAIAAVPYPAPTPEPEETTSEVKRRRIRAPDGETTFQALEHASTRDEVVRLALRGMHVTARRFAVFAVRKTGFHGWACNVELGDEEALKEVFIPAEVPSVLATATATAMYLGPIPATPAHEGLLHVMERASPDVAAVAVRVAGRAVLILLCDDLEDTMMSTRYIGDLAKAVGDALTRLISR